MRCQRGAICLWEKVITLEYVRVMVPDRFVREWRIEAVEEVR